MVRLDVVQKRCIGNPAEVDSLNSQLRIISRQVSDLKSKSPCNLTLCTPSEQVICIFLR